MVSGGCSEGQGKKATLSLAHHFIMFLSHGIICAKHVKSSMLTGWAKIVFVGKVSFGFSVETF